MCDLNPSNQRASRGHGQFPDLLVGFDVGGDGYGDVQLGEESHDALITLGDKEALVWRKESTGTPTALYGSKYEAI